MKRKKQRLLSILLIVSFIQSIAIGVIPGMAASATTAITITVADSSNQVIDPYTNAEGVSINKQLPTPVRLAAGANAKISYSLTNVTFSKYKFVTANDLTTLPAFPADSAMTNIVMPELNTYSAFQGDIGKQNYLTTKQYNYAGKAGTANTTRDVSFGSPVFDGVFTQEAKTDSSSSNKFLNTATNTYTTTNYDLGSTNGSNFYIGNRGDSSGAATTVYGGAISTPNSNTVAYNGTNYPKTKNAAWKALKVWGYFSPKTTGDYTLGAWADDGAYGYLMVGGVKKEFVNDWSLAAPKDKYNNVPIHLIGSDSGTKYYYPIYMEWYEGCPTQSSFVPEYKISGVSTSFTAIPEAELYSSNTTTPGDLAEAYFGDVSGISFPAQDGIYYIATKFISGSGASTTSGLYGPFIVDNTNPVLSNLVVTSNNANNNKLAVAGNTITAKFTASESLGGNPQVSLNGYATSATITKDSSNNYTAIINIGSNGAIDAAGDKLVDGPITLQVAHYSDLSGNAGAAVQDATITYDNTPPLATITYSQSPASVGNETITATFLEPINTSDIEQITIIPTGTATISGANMTPSTDRKTWTYNYNVNKDNGGTYKDGPATVSLSTVHDAAGNASQAPTTNTTFNINTTNPTVGLTFSANPTSTGTEVVTATYSKSVSKNYTPQIAIDQQGTNDLALTNMTPVGSDRTVWTYNYTVNANGTTTNNKTNLDGTATVSLSSVQDNAGNGVPAPSVNTFTIDTIPSTVGITYSANTAKAGTEVITATYAEPVKTGEIPQISIVQAGNSKGTYDISNVNMTPVGTAGKVWTYNYTVHADNGSTYKDGTATVSLSTVHDAAGNAAVAPTGNTFLIDTIAPTLSISTPSSSITNTSPITYTVTYSGADKVTLDGSDVTLVKTGTADGVPTESGTGNTRTVTVNSITGNGTLAIRIAANTASDSAGNYALAPGDSNTFTVDNIAPIAPVIKTPTSGATNNNTPVITGTAEAGATVIVYDGSTILGTVTADGSGKWTLTLTASLPDGTHNLTATATDAAGNVSPASSVVSIIIDTVAPTLAIGAPSNTMTNNAPITYTVTYTGADNITLKSSDVTLNKTGNATGDVSISGTGTATRTVTISNITGDGTLGITIVAGSAVDNAGNSTAASSNSATFMVDNTKPTVTILPNGSTTSAKQQSTVVTASDNNKLNSLQYQWTSSPSFPTSGTWNTISSGSILIQSTGDGNYYLQVKAIDGVGNETDKTSNTFVLDNTPPASPIITSPKDKDSINNNKPVVSGTSEPGSTVTIILDGKIVGTATADASGLWSYTVTTVLTDGVHTIYATATDVAGNVSSACTSNNFTVDTVAPTIAIGQPSNLLTNKGPVTYTITYKDADAITLSSNDVILNKTGNATGTISVSGSGTLTRTVTISNITGDGTLGIQISAGTAKDNAGNKTLASAQSSTFVVDNTSPAVPVISAPEDNASLNIKRPVFSGTSDPITKIFVYVKDSKGNVTTLGPVTSDATGAWTLTPTQDILDGDYTVYATSTDDAGNVSPNSDTKSFKIDTVSPVLTKVSISSNNTNDLSLAKVGDNVTLIFTSNKSLKNTPVVTIGGHGATVTRGVGINEYKAVYGMTSDINDGQVQFTIDFTDSLGNIGVQVNATLDNSSVTFDKTPPQLSNISIKSNNQNSNLAKPGDIITVSFDSSEKLLGTSINAKIDGNKADVKDKGNNQYEVSYTMLGSETEGIITFSIDGTDLVGNPAANSKTTTDASKVTFDKTAPDAPFIAKPTSGLTNNNKPTISGTVNLSKTNDSNPVTVTIYIGGNSSPVQVKTDSLGNWSYTPNIALTDGSYDITATATDDAGNISGVSNTDSITIDATNPAAPVVNQIASGATRDNTPNISGNVDLSATHESGPVNVTLYVSGSKGSDTVTVRTNSSGAWSYTPSALPDGDYTIKATATDDAGNTSGYSNIVNLTIDTVKPAPPSITSPRTGFVTKDNTPTINGTVNLDATHESNPVTVTVYINGIRYATIDGISDNWSYSPGELSDGIYNISATATDSAGNVSGYSNIPTITIDTTKPETPIIANTKDANGSKAILISTKEANLDVSVYVTQNGKNSYSKKATLITGSDGTCIYSPVSPDKIDGTTTYVIATDKANNSSSKSNILKNLAQNYSTRVSVGAINSRNKVWVTVNDADLKQDLKKLDITTNESVLSGGNVHQITPGTNKMELRKDNTNNLDTKLYVKTDKNGNPLLGINALVKKAAGAVQYEMTITIGENSYDVIVTVKTVAENGVM